MKGKFKDRNVTTCLSNKHNSGENAHYLFSFVYVNHRRDTRIFHVINMINNLYNSPHQKESCEMRR